MRELLLVSLGLIFIVGGVGAFRWVRRFERRTADLGWEDPRQVFGKRRWIQLVASVATAAGVYVVAVQGLGLVGAANSSGLGLVFLLISLIWFAFRKDIARYQYQIVMTMVSRNLPEREEAQQQEKAMEYLGTGFSVLLFSAGVLLLILNFVLR